MGVGAGPSTAPSATVHATTGSVTVSVGPGVALAARLGEAALEAGDGPAADGTASRLEVAPLGGEGVRPAPPLPAGDGEAVPSGVDAVAPGTPGDAVAADGRTTGGEAASSAGDALSTPAAGDALGTELGADCPEQADSTVARTSTASAAIRRARTGGGGREIVGLVCMRPRSMPRRRSVGSGAPGNVSSNGLRTREIGTAVTHRVVASRVYRPTTYRPIRLDATAPRRDDEPMRQDRDEGRGSNPPDRWGTTGEATATDAVEDPLAYETVILPARVDSEVARRVAIASSRDGISIADLLGRPAAAYDWQVDDDRSRAPEIG